MEGVRFWLRTDGFWDRLQEPSRIERLKAPNRAIGSIKVRGKYSKNCLFNLRRDEMLNPEQRKVKITVHTRGKTPEVNYHHLTEETCLLQGHESFLMTLESFHR